MERPGASEAAPYYFRYIDLVPSGDVLSVLEGQTRETVALLEPISEERSRHRYAPDKWSIRQVLSHVNDAERVFASRALWFARGFESPLPSFDQETSAAAAGADERAWASHVDEFGDTDAINARLRTSPASTTINTSFVERENFTLRQRNRRLTRKTSGFSKELPWLEKQLWLALAYIVAGHVFHHAAVLRERYA